MKKLLFLLLATMLLSAKGYCRSDLTINYTVPYVYSNQCNYTISISALVYNMSTGTYAMTVAQNFVISAGTTQNITLSKPLGYSIVPGQFMFTITPNTGGCNFGVNYTGGSTPPSPTTNLCTCYGVSSSSISIQTYWFKNADDNYTFYQYCPGC